jgi:UDP-N-acetylglucosamine transferase subunit ALG13
VIFLTVGTQLPFPRLIDAVDAWAGRNPGIEVIAQTGPIAAAAPKHLRAQPFMPPGDIDRNVRTAEVVVAHAGIGSILTAQRHRRPIIIVPRRASQGEHRNDHQVATARHLGGRPGIAVAEDTDALLRLLDDRARLACGDGISDHADPAFTDRLRDFILTGRKPGP